MRFVADGPLLPDELLVARDEGRVIFFCGAGVSMARAHLPTFYQLADRVVNALGSTSDSPARQLIAAANAQQRINGVSGLLPADRVFALLEREFEVADVRSEVAAALRPEDAADLSAHRILLDLSRGPDGRRRLVTTNFDLMFEAADPALPVHHPPLLPDPRRAREFEGIVHLHGRVTADYARAHDDEFVLSSADFGRAYLADGWATQFIQALLDGYQLVFVGYTADDPPVQYLLEALSERVRARGGLYAFQAGRPDEARGIWRSKGVDAIAYDGADDHAALWGTLEAWAERANDPTAWAQRVLQRARAGPRGLAPHERGQVKHLAMFSESAGLLGPARLPASWLCVFDPQIRYGTPPVPHDGEEPFDPFAAFGLDDDPEPDPAEPDHPYKQRQMPAGAWDAFAPSSRDRPAATPPAEIAFRGAAALGSSRLPPRLWRLARWITEVAGEPAAAWWAAGQDGLHPELTGMVLHEFDRRTDAQTVVEQAWRAIAQGWTERPRTTRANWYALQAEIRRTSWTPSALRGVAELLRPYVIARQPRSSQPPLGDVSQLTLRDIAHLEAQYPKPPPGLDVPDAVVPQAAAIARAALERGVEVSLETMGFDYFSAPPIAPDPALGDRGFERGYGVAGPFFRYVALFQRLKVLDVAAARREVVAWPADVAAFDRLRIWVAGLPRLLSDAQTGRMLTSLNDDAFWDSRHQRDLLLALRQRWPSLAGYRRRALEQRLLAGRPPYEGEASDEHVRISAWRSLERILWLHNAGCEFSFSVEMERARLAALATDWRDEAADEAAASLEGRSGSVSRNTDATGLIGVSPTSLLAIARQMSRREFREFVENAPLDGLAAERPVQVLRALVLAERRGEFSEWGWRTLLSSDARGEDRLRLRRQIAERLARLPSEHLAAISYAVTGWFQRAAASLPAEAPDTYDRVWAAIIGYLRADPSSGGSAVRSSSPDWVTSALNAPPGKLAQALMAHPQREGPDGERFDAAWLAKVTELVSLPENVGRLAIVLLLYNLPWFHYRDQQWAEAHMLGLLQGSPEDVDAFWAGYLSSGRLPPETLFQQLKPQLLALARQPSDRHHQASMLAAYLLAYWLPNEHGGPLVSDAELRDVLVEGTQEFRLQAIWYLERWRAKEPELRADALRLLRTVWPRQRSTKSPEVSDRLAHMALESADDFPQMVDAVLRHLTPGTTATFTLASFDEDRQALLAQHPTDFLRLIHALLPEDVADWPYGAGDVVEGMAANEALADDSRLADLRRRMTPR